MLRSIICSLLLGFPLLCSTSYRVDSQFVDFSSAYSSLYSSSATCPLPHHNSIITDLSAIQHLSQHHYIDPYQPTIKLDQLLRLCTAQTITYLHHIKMLTHSAKQWQSAYMKQQQDEYAMSEQLETFQNELSKVREEYRMLSIYHKQSKDQIKKLKHEHSEREDQWWKERQQLKEQIEQLEHKSGKQHSSTNSTCQIDASTVQLSEKLMFVFAVIR